MTNVQGEQTYALINLLSFYNQGYDRNQEDKEFIVRLPQTIAENLYDNKIAQIYEPLMEYWQEEISPAAQAYQEQYDISETCLSPSDYSDFF